MPKAPKLSVVSTANSRRASPLDDIIKSFARSLKATNLSDRTIETYSDSAQQFARFLGEHRLRQEMA